MSLVGPPITFMLSVMCRKCEPMQNARDRATDLCVAHLQLISCGTHTAPGRYLIPLWRACHPASIYARLTGLRVGRQRPGPHLTAPVYTADMQATRASARSCQMKSTDAGGAWLAGLGNRGLSSSVSGSGGVLGSAVAGGRGLLAQLVGLETRERLLNFSRQLGGL